MIKRKKVKLLPRRSALPRAGQRAEVLRPSGSVEVSYSNAWVRLVDEMRDIVVPTVLADYRDSVGTGMDAGQTLWDRLLAKLTEKFATAAPAMANALVRRVDVNARTGLQRSLREVAKDFTFPQTNSKPVQDAINEQIGYNTYYIKRIPVEFLDKVRQSVEDSITKGNGLEDLEKVMLERYGEAKRHAKNVALDQTRKAYMAINTERMRDVGVTKFEWIHTGGSQDPRQYHKTTLNGNVYDLNDPPIIDQRTGERGLPGLLPFCRCTMRPVVTFEDE